MLRPVESTPKPADELREDQYGIVHYCTWRAQRDIRLGSDAYWFAHLVCGCYLVTQTVQSAVNCIACLTHKDFSALEIIEASHARQGT